MFNDSTLNLCTSYIPWYPLYVQGYVLQYENIRGFPVQFQS